MVFQNFKLLTSNKVFTNKLMLVHQARNTSIIMADKVLSTENRKRCVKKLSSMSHLAVSDSSVPYAAVLVPLCKVKDELCLLYTLRSSKLRSHRGEVSFPGGLRERGDTDPVDTALRETEEELGINRADVDVWGVCPQFGTWRTERRVTPVLAYIGEISLDKLKLNPDEVESVFVRSLSDLCNPSNYGHTQFRTRKGYCLPVFIGGEHKIWGLTAVCTHVVLSALLPDLYRHKLKFVPPIKIQEKR